MILFYTFALAALSGLAVDQIARREGSRGPDSWRALAGVALPLSLLAVLPPRAEAFLLSALVLIIAVFYVRRPAWRAAALVGLVGVVAIDLFFATLNVAQRPYHNLAAFDGEIESFSFIQKHQGLDRTYVHARWGTHPRLAAKQATLRGIYSLSDYEVLSLDRYANYCRTMDPDPRRVAEQTPFIGDCYMKPTPQGLNLLRWLGVRFVVAQKSASDLVELLDANGWRQVFTSTEGATAVYESPRTLPRAYVAYNYVVPPSPSNALEMMQRPVVDPWKLIVIERDSETPTWVEERSVSGPAIEPAKILRYSPTLVEIEARAESPGILVLTDTFYPGWSAFVDGERVPVQRVNYLFRGVPLAAGTHRVTFRFVPTSVLVGAGLSIASLLVCAAAVVRG